MSWSHVGYRPTPEHHGSDSFAPALGGRLLSEVSGTGLPEVAAGFSGDQIPSGKHEGRDRPDIRGVAFTQKAADKEDDEGTMINGQ
ncbi:hypothetical protein SAMN03080598_02509 [Algoriphagus boritolerans DSM 17298 = JCM 18970]|uniref:Uncharacterized protein n=1 Tax=Algoriphagus boritolerans DSM 17298 = JCM 18970 TaxID=1120964 RepID=A0A1H5XH12_9BACT|nr:hypothetical protein SAMN03080598_02509 [Algoriphagus boritolerans DSM 17298 = JCM 18970]